MKQYFLFLCILSIIATASCVSKFSSSALQDVATRGQRQRKTRLTDTQYQKERQRKRQERHAKKAMQRERNAKERSKKLQSLYNQTDAKRTSADHVERSGNLCRAKAKIRAEHKAIAAEKTAYVETQLAIAEEKINVHKAARDALLRQL